MDYSRGWEVGYKGVILVEWCLVGVVVMWMRGKIGVGSSSGIIWKGVLVLCVVSFCVGLLFMNWMWSGLEFSDDVRMDCDF